MSARRYYTYRSLHREREYGAFWYSALWRVLRPILVAVCVAVAVFGILSTAWNAVYIRYAAPVESGESAQTVAFTVASGDSLTRVARNLEEAGLIRSATVFKYYCDFSGLGQKIQAGSYQLEQTMSMTDIARQLILGDSVPRVRNITLIPGWTVAEFAEDLVQRGVLDDSERFLELCRTGEAFSDYYYIADVLESGASSRVYALEGYLAADTYEFYTTATEEDIIRKLLSQTDNVFTQEDQERADELGITMDQVFTLASLIEKEAKTDDMSRVSAVFHNRLRRGMRLDSDVTIHYITGVRKMALTDSDLAVDSPYNTYRVTGLPPGPICSPSRAAIQAALYPDETFLSEGYLYFCAKDPESGELYFSRTLQEHNQAVEAYRESWRRWDEERGIE